MSTIVHARNRTPDRTATRAGAPRRWRTTTAWLLATLSGVVAAAVLPRGPVTGSASRAPASASFFISGSGLISLRIGMKPESVAPSGTANGNARAAIASAAALRTSGGSASRRAIIARRRSDFASRI